MPPALIYYPMLNLCHLSRLIPQQAERYGQRTALSWRDYDSHTWQPVSWVQFAAHVDHVAQALVANGVDVQENIAAFSQNKPECFYVNFGAYSVRAVPIPFYATSSGAQVTYMVNDAAVRLIFLGEQEQYDTMMSVLPLCHSVERIVIFDRAVKRRENDRLSVYFDEWETAEAPAGAAAEAGDDDGEADALDVRVDVLDRVLGREARGDDVAAGAASRQAVAAEEGEVVATLGRGGVRVGGRVAELVAEGARDAAGDAHAGRADAEEKKGGRGVHLKSLPKRSPRRDCSSPLRLA